VNGTRVFLLPCQWRCLGSTWRHWLSRYFCHFRRLKKELKQLVSFAFHVEYWVCVASWIIPVMQLLPQPYFTMLWMKLLMWPNKGFIRRVRSEHSSDITVNKTTCASAHRAPGKKTAVPIFKVLARTGGESNFRPTSTNADALTTWPWAGQISKWDSAYKSANWSTEQRLLNKGGGAKNQRHVANNQRHVANYQRKPNN